jgi:chemotaxis signal transduction protein
VPVIDAARLLGEGESQPGRLVTLKINGRLVALAVDEVVRIVSIPAEQLQHLPPLLANARRDMISALGSLDNQLLIQLQGAQVVPESVWAAIESKPRRYDDIS